MIERWGLRFGSTEKWPRRPWEEMPRPSHIACSNHDAPTISGASRSKVRFAKSGLTAYLGFMPKPFEFCIPTRRQSCRPAKNGCTKSSVTVTGCASSATAIACAWITKSGDDYTKRYPLIVEAARRIRTTQFIVDGEAVVLGVDGRSSFEDLHSGKTNDEVQLYAFDLIEMGGDDLRACASRCARRTSRG